jgi:hypothetical protein
MLITRLGCLLKHPLSNGTFYVLIPNYYFKLELSSLSSFCFLLHYDGAGTRDPGEDAPDGSVALSHPRVAARLWAAAGNLRGAPLPAQGNRRKNCSTASQSIRNLGLPRIKFRDILKKKN